MSSSKNKKLLIIESSSSPAISSTSSNTNPCTENLEKSYQESQCEKKRDTQECNTFLLKKELVERNCLKQEEQNNSLYPNLNDEQFNIKIAEKKEFHDTQYDGTIYENIKERADILSKASFEIQPHQAFVKNFLSSQTPYNSLLLFHGLGSGKTYSAIGVCEEMREYVKQMGISKRILIVASENVQENFKLQLFDERNLVLVEGVWTIKGIAGNQLLREVNPMNMKGISKEKIISQIKSVINQSYLFLGYGQFANYIIKTIYYNKDHKNIQLTNNTEKIVLDKKMIKRIRNEFSNRLIVIDEVHNIRKTEDNTNKKVAIFLEMMVKAAENVRLLLLSATPMYNSYKEIVWLLNLMNMNDRRGKVQVKDLFDAMGNFKSEGEEMLIRKATGYISFVRGENPYTFPYRIYPNEFSVKNTFPFIPYPSYQMNGKKIKEEDKKRILSLYLNQFNKCESCGDCQACTYRYIIENLQQTKFNKTTKKGVVIEMPNFENMESFGYTMLQIPLESLIISYPKEGLKETLKKMPLKVYSEELEEKETLNSSSSVESSTTESSKDLLTIDPNELTGTKGLSRMMNFKDEKSPPEKGSFSYKKTTLDQYGNIFSREKIGKYSSKIRTILDFIVSGAGKVSEGVILIYSQYIDAGLIPMALALEEMGFTRYGENVKPLFKEKPSEVVDVRTMKPSKNKMENKKDFMPARYSMITGDLRLSPNNVFEVTGLTNKDNQEGHKVKVVLISKAGSEGIDFKYIRQVHILEPWYNMNRIEQIIGRAVRNFSHKDLPFEKRNVQIFMHGTILENSKEEAADLYVYRVAESKAIQIGHVTRVLKETAVDCLLNHDQTNFTQENFQQFLKEPIRQELSDGQILNQFKIGDAPFSPACDYMATCNYTCRPDKKINDSDVNEDTYNEFYIVMNSEKILQKIRLLMKESFFYKKNTLLQLIQTPKPYPYAQIYSALTQLVDDRNEYIIDKYGRNGHLVNIGDYYLFQPLELNDVNASLFERSVPIDYKNDFIDFQLQPKVAASIQEREKLQSEKQQDQENPKDKEEAKKILANLKEKYEITQEYMKGKQVSRGDDDWYKHCGNVIRKMSKDYEDSKKYLLEFLADHMMDLLLFDEKLIIMNYLYSLDHLERNSLEWFLKDYIEKNSIVTKTVTGFLMYDVTKRKFFILNKKNQWIEAEPEDEREILESPEAKRMFDSDKKDFNSIIGFIGYEKNNRYLVFKTKDITVKRNTGARCDEAGKQKTLDLLNTIVGEDKYTKETTKLIKNKEGTIVQEAMSQTELCVLQEFLLRYYDKINKNGKKWFLTSEMAILLKV